MIVANILQPLIDAADWVITFFHNDVGLSWGWSIVALTFTTRLSNLVPLYVRLSFSYVSARRERERHDRPAPARTGHAGSEGDDQVGPRRRSAAWRCSRRSCVRLVLVRFLSCAAPTSGSGKWKSLRSATGSQPPWLQGCSGAGRRRGSTRRESPNSRTASTAWPDGGLVLAAAWRFGETKALVEADQGEENSHESRAKCAKPCAHCSSIQTRGSLAPVHA